MLREGALTGPFRVPQTPPPNKDSEGRNRGEADAGQKVLLVDCSIRGKVQLEYKNIVSACFLFFGLRWRFF